MGEQCPNSPWSALDSEQQTGLAGYHFVDNTFYNLNPFLNVNYQVTLLRSLLLWQRTNGISTVLRDKADLHGLTRTPPTKGRAILVSYLFLN